MNAVETFGLIVFLVNCTELIKQMTPSHSTIFSLTLFYHYICSNYAWVLLFANYVNVMQIVYKKSLYIKSS